MTASKLTKQQYKHSEYRFTLANGCGGNFLPDGNYRAVVMFRYDDECGNGHNTFAATAQIYGGPWQKSQPKGEPVISGACVGHLAQAMKAAGPEHAAQDHAQLLETADMWHLCSSDGPLHYIASTVYLAGDRDHNGRRKGQESAWEYGVRFNGVPVTYRVRASFWKFLKAKIEAGAGWNGETGLPGELEPVSIAHEQRKGETFDFKPKWTLPGFAEKWHECPWGDETQAREFCGALNTCAVEFIRIPTAWSDGKARELDSARRAAIWPEATDEELSAEPDVLRAKLAARLPGLLAEFRAFVESLGFVW